MIGSLSRRRFVALGAAGALAAVTRRGVAAAGASLDGAAAAGGDAWLDAGFGRLQWLMANGHLTSRSLTERYLARIAELNPTLHAIIETNPDALRIAARRDAERRAGRVRGPLHGVPIAVKDNIATDDRMETTAGSLALVGSEVPADAPIVRQLRAAGAVIIGKANLSEWANFRGGNPEFPPINGWSARGGFTRNPYVLDADPCGSSSGSAAAVAADLCAAAIGTETDGSILCPAGEQSLVGLKPTVGLVSGTGIIPIAHSQDTAGPMTRTVRDAAVLLDAIRVQRDRLRGHRLPRTYTNFIVRDGLVGARLAYDRRYTGPDYGPGDDEELAMIDEILARLRAAGAEVLDVETADPVAPDAAGRIPYDDEFTVLLFEFKVQIAEYLATLRGTEMRTLTDLIAFNVAHCDEELRWFGQEVFEAAEATSGDLTDPEYLAALAGSQGYGRSVIDGVLAQGFDAIITPSFSFGTSPAAMGGYPSMSVPVGYTSSGRPIGLWLAAGALQEGVLIRLGHGIEQLLGVPRPAGVHRCGAAGPHPVPGLRRPRRAGAVRGRSGRRWARRPRGSRIGAPPSALVNLDVRSRSRPGRMDRHAATAPRRPWTPTTTSPHPPASSSQRTRSRGRSCAPAGPAVSTSTPARRRWRRRST